MWEQQFLKFSSDAFLWCFSKKHMERLNLMWYTHIYVSVPYKDKIYNVFISLEHIMSQSLLSTQHVKKAREL